MQITKNKSLKAILYFDKDGLSEIAIPKGISECNLAFNILTGDHLGNGLNFNRFDT